MMNLNTQRTIQVLVFAISLPTVVLAQTYNDVGRVRTVSHYRESMTAPESNNCGCGSLQCGVCGPQSRIPNAAIMCPPTQPTGVTSGASAPCITGVDCAVGPAGEKRWNYAADIDFQPLWHGEFIGPVRLPALLEYRIRVNDEITFTYIPNRDRVNEEYRLMVGDTIAISSVSDDSIKQDKVIIQPDGKIHLKVLDAPLEAAGKSLTVLRKDLEVAYKKYIVSPAINIEPIAVNTALLDLLDSVNGPFAAGGRALIATVNPDGRVQLPRVGGVYVIGMTLDEIKREINLRYKDQLVGVEVEPRLTRTAPHFFHVYGQVAKPGRYELNGPTSVTAGLAQAEGILLGGNSRQVVIFRRAEDWRLVSTMLDLRGGHLGKRPSPSDEIWLRDSDLIIVPPRPITRANQAIQQIFTDGIYRVVPFTVQQGGN
ncbi:MAG: polysaccharide biosynthesis/export family protein [Pirellula sp.]